MNSKAVGSTRRDHLVKLRSSPEEFRVDEVGGPQATEGEFTLYRLEKTGHDTLALLARLSNELGVKRSDWGTAGLKDRHAVTTQLVTLSTDLGDRWGEGWSLTRLGSVAERLRSGDHDGNRFTLVIRDITPEQVQRLEGRLDQLDRHGIPNWFDSQRFGSAVNGELPGAAIIERNFERAMGLYLTEAHPSDRAGPRRDKRHLSQIWPNLHGVGRLEHKPLIRCVSAWRRAETEPWKAAYLAIPRDLRGMWLSAWQSRDWNRQLTKELEGLFEDHLLQRVELNSGDVLSYPNAPPGKSGVSKHSLIEDISRNIQKIPATLPMRVEDLSDVEGFLTDHSRDTVIHPGDLKCSSPQRDERNGNSRNKRSKCTLSFSLPPGAYATNVVKRLFH
jgi:tRNA pseudouridine13 synthase